MPSSGRTVTIQTDGYAVSLTHLGETAVALTERRRPDVVVMDLRMPVMDGIEATEEIVRNVPDAKVLIVGMQDKTTPPDTDADRAFEALGDNALEAFISRLRKKITGSGAMIRTLRGIGYVLEEQA